MFYLILGIILGILFIADIIVSAIGYVKKSAYCELAQLYNEELCENQKLVIDYNNLNSSYNALIDNYNALCKDYNELSDEYDAPEEKLNLGDLNADV